MLSSWVLGTSFGLFYLFRNRVELKLVNTSKLVLNDLLNFGGESLNLFLRTFFLLSTFFVATALASHISPHTVAAQDIALKLWIFGAFLMDGFAITATSLGGKLVGEKNFKLWREINDKLVVLGVAVGVLLACIYYFGQSNLIGIFTTDASLITIISSYYFILIIAQPLNGLVFVYDGILFGSRSHKFLRNSMAISTGLGTLPFFIAAYHLGDATYVLWGLFATNIFRGLTTWRYLKTKFI